MVSLSLFFLSISNAVLLVDVSCGFVMCVYCIAWTKLAIILNALTSYTLDVNRKQGFDPLHLTDNPENSQFLRYVTTGFFCNLSQCFL